jgi:phenylpyruvate tautomerase PptA (4-oxalocrotonate tautomerase family)
MGAMPHDLPAWVAELTDPRRAATLDELADRLVPLAEHAIDVSRRLQAQLNELNDPFKREALYGRVERLKARVGEALDEITAEIAASGEERIERVWADWAERAGPGEHGARERELRRLLDRDIVPVLSEQQRDVAERVAERTSRALEDATQTLLTRVEELAKAVTDLIHDVLPLAREGLTLASRISALSGHARKAGRGPVRTS